MPINNSISAGLTKAAKILAKRIRDNLRSGDYPKEIEKEMKIGSAKMQGEHFQSIEIKFFAPMSAAFERGSGEHGPDNESYEIRPDKAGALAFHWEKTPRGPGKKYIGQVESGKKLFRFVDHPGIEPRPYIAPALEEERENMKKAIGQVFMAVVRDGNKKVTKL
ncbi:hypothetical protein GF373_17375 [bacterium]|nr:hypothetical protein [bacterium]